MNCLSCVTNENVLHTVWLSWNLRHWITDHWLLAQYPILHFRTVHSEASVIWCCLCRCHAVHQQLHLSYTHLWGAHSGPGCDPVWMAQEKMVSVFAFLSSQWLERMNKSMPDYCIHFHLEWRDPMLKWRKKKWPYPRVKGGLAIYLWGGQYWR
jgi:hypothetical protein